MHIQTCSEKVLHSHTLFGLFFFLCQDGSYVLLFTFKKETLEVQFPVHVFFFFQQNLTKMDKDSFKDFADERTEQFKNRAMVLKDFLNPLSAVKHFPFLALCLQHNLLDVKQVRHLLCTIVPVQGSVGIGRGLDIHLLGLKSTLNEAISKAIDSELNGLMDVLDPLTESLAVTLKENLVTHMRNDETCRSIWECLFLESFQFNFPVCIGNYVKTDSHFIMYQLAGQLVFDRTNRWFRKMETLNHSKGLKTIARNSSESMKKLCLLLSKHREFLCH